MSYKTWKSKNNIWEIVTAIPKEQQAIIVLLESFEGNPKAQKAVSELTATEANHENGMKLLREKLARVFESDKIDEVYIVYLRLKNRHKSDEMPMTDYIIKFEHLSHKRNNHVMPLTNTVLTFKLLDGAKLKEVERK